MDDSPCLVRRDQVDNLVFDSFGHSKKLGNWNQNWEKMMVMEEVEEGEEEGMKREGEGGRKRVHQQDEVEVGVEVEVEVEIEIEVVVEEWLIHLSQC